MRVLLGRVISLADQLALAVLGFSDKSRSKNYSPRLSFTARAISCSEPRYLSVVCMDECPSKNLICSRSPPAFRQSLAQVRRRSCAPNPHNQTSDSYVVHSARLQIG